MKVFLGGTCNESTWRADLIPLLKIGFFNPVVDNWNEEVMQRELTERRECDYCLYTITPKMMGVYSIAEVVDDSNKRPHRTILALEARDDGAEFTEAQWRSLEAVAGMVRRNGGHVFYNLLDVAVFLNNQRT